MQSKAEQSASSKTEKCLQRAVLENGLMTKHYYQAMQHIKQKQMCNSGKIK